MKTVSQQESNAKQRTVPALGEIRLNENTHIGHIGATSSEENGSVLIPFTDGVGNRNQLWLWSPFREGCVGRDKDGGGPDGTREAEREPPPGYTEADNESEPDDGRTRCLHRRFCKPPIRTTYSTAL